MYTEISRNHKSPERRWQEMLLKIKFYKDIFPEYQKYLDDLDFLSFLPLHTAVVFPFMKKTRSYKDLSWIFVKVKYDKGQFGRHFCL